MNKKINAWLSLVRIPNSLTLLGDILLGIILSLGVSFSFQVYLVEIIALILSSILFYFAGLILNDLCDYKEDSKLGRTNRPLVAKEISFKQAKFGLLICCLGSLILAAYVSWISFFIGLSLLVLIFIYNLVGRYWSFLGFFIMGLCRFKNILLGSSLGLSEDKNLSSDFYFFAILEFIYISIICRIAYDEEKKMPPQFWCKLLFIIPLACLFYFILELYKSLVNFDNFFQISFFYGYILSFIILLFFIKKILLIIFQLKSNLDPAKISPIIGQLIGLLIVYQAFFICLRGYEITSFILISLYYTNRFWNKKFYAS